jgi:hypothetical protein
MNISSSIIISSSIDGFECADNLDCIGIQLYAIRQ